MKRFLFSTLLLNLVVLSIYAQYPGYGMTVKSMEVSSKPLTEYINTDEGHVTLFVFWKTCCPTNLNMIDCLFELTDEYGNSDDISIVLVFVDDTRSTDRVMPVVRTKGWKADVILDVNMELATIFSILAVLSLTGCSASDAGKANDTLDEQADHIEVIYFHGNMRCLTCRAIEKFAQETVDSFFKDEVNSGKVLFRAVSIPENEAMADDYRTTGSSLFVTSFINGKETRNNMTEFGFRTARKNHVLFQDSLANVIRQSLENVRP